MHEVQTLNVDGSPMEVFIFEPERAAPRPALIPEPADVDDYDEALSAAGVRHVFHRYAGAGHAFQNFPTPERYRHEASEDAWGKVLEFFGKHLTISGAR